MIENMSPSGHVSAAVIKAITENMPEGQVLNNLTELFKVCGDSTRLKILYALSESEMSVGDIAELLRKNQSAISHQLRVLKVNRLVKYRREGKVIFYSLAPSQITTILNQGLEHIQE